VFPDSVNSKFHNKEQSLRFLILAIFKYPALPAKTADESAIIMQIHHIHVDLYSLLQEVGMQQL